MTHKLTQTIIDITNQLKGFYKEEDYRKIIIPFLFVKRIDELIYPHLRDIKDVLDKLLPSLSENTNEDLLEKVILKKIKPKFYNTSAFTLTSLLNDSSSLLSNFQHFINSFNKTIREILEQFSFVSELEKLNHNNILYIVTKSFVQLDLSEASVDVPAMGKIFEEVIRHFSQNSEAASHFTSKEIVDLMIKLTLAEGNDDIILKDKVIKILDPACGTGGILIEAHKYLMRLNQEAKIYLYGQEISNESLAICKSNMLIHGLDIKNIYSKNTLVEDCFAELKMRFVFIDPPFGSPWGGKSAPVGLERIVKNQVSSEGYSRFSMGLPQTSDSQLLFLQHVICKLDDLEGQAAFLSNNSILHSGALNSGESQIRQALLESDIIEAIIELPTDLAHNSGGTAIYVWILSKNKEPKRKRKVQLIDASSLYTTLPKCIGNKKKTISDEQINEIYQIFKDFKDSKYSKIFDIEEFMQHEYSYYLPTQRSSVISQENIRSFLNVGFLIDLFGETIISQLGDEWIDSLMENTIQEDLELNGAQRLVFDIHQTLTTNQSDKVFNNYEVFCAHIEQILSQIEGVDKKMIEKICELFSKNDINAEVIKDKKGKHIPFKSSRETEIIPYTTSVEEHFEEFVKPFLPNAIVQHSSKKEVGAKILFSKYFYCPEHESLDSKKLLDELTEMTEENLALLAKLKGSTFN